jgi:hypothetical protein
MIHPDRMLGRSRPLDEDWGDTRPGIHPVGGRQPYPVEDRETSTEDADRTLLQAARRVLASTAIAWGFFSARSAKGDQASGHFG